MSFHGVPQWFFTIAISFVILYVIYYEWKLKK